MDDDRGLGGIEELRYVLDVGEDCVFQTVAGVRPTAAFPGAKVLSEPGIRNFIVKVMKK